jgi:hypothetical protein
MPEATQRDLSQREILLYLKDINCKEIENGLGLEEVEGVCVGCLNFPNA